MEREKKVPCQFCGMLLFNTSETCPKCDSVIGNQFKPSTLTIDIAHNKETVTQALVKLHGVLKRNKVMKHRQIRVIVGSKIIRSAVIKELETLKRGKTIFDFKTDGKNSGALLVRMEH